MSTTAQSRRSRSHAPAAPAADPTRFRSAVEGLMGAIDSGGEQLPPAEVTAAREVLTRGAQRLGFTGAHTVVALAGATGSGKSTIFNRLVGEEVARTGERRPTTSRIQAAVWGADDATALLDWLDAPSRHHVEASRRAKPDDALTLDGLVLLDLPDVDSHESAHRAEADRVLGLCDVFVWVTDPQKYADAVLHDEYLQRAKHHQTVTLVVLNQADRMRSDQAKACRDDLRRLLTQDGLPEAEVLLVSARTGLGLEELATALSGAAKAASAARARLHGDVVHHASELRRHVADAEVEVPEAPPADVVEALEVAAAVPHVLRSVEADYRRRALARTGWIFSRWVRLRKPDPLRRLGLDPAAVDDETRLAVTRSSLPQATPAARAAVDLTTRRLGERAAQGLPPRWANAVEDAATPDRDRLVDALDQAVVSTDLRTKDPVWWTVFGGLQWLCAAAALVGLIWLVVLGVMGWLQLPLPGTPYLGAVPVPTLLLFVGVLLGLVLAALARPLAAAGARRRMETVRERLRQGITGVAVSHLIAPVRDVVTRHARTRDHLEAALH